MKIGEPDAVYGCGNSHLFDQHTQIQHYQYEGKYKSVVEACDLQLFLNPSQQFKGDSCIIIVTNSIQYS